MNVAVISLGPLGAVGGSERFTLDAIQSIRAAGDSCEAFAIREGDSTFLGGPGNDARPFVHTFDGHGERELSFREVLRLLGRFDAVWVHQYLGSVLIFDILGAVRPDLPILLTNLGDETVLGEFATRYRPHPRHEFVHPTEALGRCGKLFGQPGHTIPVGIWSDVFGCVNNVERHQSQLCTLDGVRADTGLEIAVRALPAHCTLIVCGLANADASYLAMLRREIGESKVLFTGDVPQTRRHSVMAASQVLIAAHTSVRYDGQPSRVDAFASTILLEAVGCGTLPVASDLDSHKEVMASLGLSDLVYPARDHAALQRLIERVLAMSPAEVDARKVRARAQIHQVWLWDDYWTRVCRELRMDASDQTPMSVKPAVPGGRSSVTSHSVHAIAGFDWKVFQPGRAS